jgi:hypothetical protein
VDASVQRVQPEPVVAGARGRLRAPERRRREQRGRGDEAAQFPLDPLPANGRGEHAEPRTPRGDGLGEQLDVTA